MVRGSKLGLRVWVGTELGLETRVTAIAIKRTNRFYIRILRAVDS